MSAPTQIAVTRDGGSIDLADVPAIDSAAMLTVLRHLIGTGQGLAFLKGLDEPELASVEAALWRIELPHGTTHLAVTLRFRALIAVFGATRLRRLFMSRGLKLMWAAAELGARERLNVRFGFRAQRFLASLDVATRSPAQALAQTVTIRHAEAA
jgi:hypothetical protein